MVYGESVLFGGKDGIDKTLTKTIYIMRERLIWGSIFFFLIGRIAVKNGNKK